MGWFTLNGVTNPRFTKPNDDLNAPDDPEVSFAEQMGAVVDEARALVMELGLRPYRVWLVVVKWSGEEIGRGDPVVVRETELLPTPLWDSRPIYSEMRSAGRVDQGQTRLREVSPRYTEDDIWGMFNPASGEQVFVEVRHDARDGNTQRRRHMVRGQPFRDATGFGWTVNLSTEQQARERDGSIETGTVYPEREQV